VHTPQTKQAVAGPGQGNENLLRYKLSQARINRVPVLIKDSPKFYLVQIHNSVSHLSKALSMSWTLPFSLPWQLVFVVISLRSRFFCVSDFMHLLHLM